MHTGACDDDVHQANDLVEFDHSEAVHAVGDMGKGSSTSHDTKSLYTANEANTMTVYFLSILEFGTVTMATFPKVFVIYTLPE